MSITWTLLLISSQVFDYIIYIYCPLYTYIYCPSLQYMYVNDRLSGPYPTGASRPPLFCRSDQYFTDVAFIYRQVCPGSSVYMRMLVEITLVWGIGFATSPPTSSPSWFGDDGEGDGPMRTPKRGLTSAGAGVSLAVCANREYLNEFDDENVVLAQQKAPRFCLLRLL